MLSKKSEQEARIAIAFTANIKQRISYSEVTFNMMMILGIFSISQVLQFVDVNFLLVHCVAILDPASFDHIWISYSNKNKTWLKKFSDTFQKNIQSSSTAAPGSIWLLTITAENSKFPDKKIKLPFKIPVKWLDLEGQVEWCH